MKKDYDDFKKHPEYDTFIREELVLEDEDFGPAKYLNSAIIRPMETEENDAEENPAEKAFGNYTFLLGMLWCTAPLRRTMGTQVQIHPRSFPTSTPSLCQPFLVFSLLSIISVKEKGKTRQKQKGKK